MKREPSLRTIALVILLLAGLVLAAPTAGACGQCDRGVPCATMAAPEPIVEAHSCCSGDEVETSAQTTRSPIGAEACDCGRDAPVAIAVVEAPAPEHDRDEAPDTEVVWTDTVLSMAAADGHHLPTTPPHPLIFLLDCVFLT